MQTTPCPICGQPKALPRLQTCSKACRIKYRQAQNRRDPYHGQAQPWRKSTVGARLTEETR